MITDTINIIINKIIVAACYEASPSDFGDEVQFSSTNSGNNLQLGINTNNIIESGV